LLFSQSDATRDGVSSLVTELTARGAQVMIAGAQHADAVSLATLPSHPAIEPMLMIQSFYLMVNAVALTRGCDPDRPPHSYKVTETI
jgi:glutamine---fructose-6-phosphate transaminase (isomerizing)